MLPANDSPSPSPNPNPDPNPNPNLGTKIELCSLLVHVDFASDRVGMSMLGIGGEHVPPPPPPPPPLPPPEVEVHQNYP